MPIHIVNENELGLGWMITSVEPPKLCASFAVKGTFTLVPNAPAERTGEQDAIRGSETVIPDDPTSSLRYSSDLVPMKPKVDLLFSATCHTPEGTPRNVCPTQIQVGGWSKTVVVFGDRFSKRGLFATLSEPQPFSEMPIVYERTYGGDGFGPNPCGVGRSAEIGPDGNKLWRLPNIVAAHQDHRSKEIRLDSEPGAEDDPVGYGPIKDSWEPRTRKTGTYGKKWQRERWPWVPDDFDWTYHNAAPLDQQVEALSGDETLVFENLHPSSAVYEAQLPCMRIRLFVENADKEGNVEFEEVGLFLDTLWADPAAEKLSLVWRGQAPVASPKAENIRAIVVGCEPLADAPLPKDHYATALAADRNADAEEDAAEEAEEKAEQEEVDKEIADHKAEHDAAMEEHAKEMEQFNASIAEAEAEGAALQAEQMPVLEDVIAPAGDPAALLAPAEPISDPGAVAAYTEHLERLGTVDPELPAKAADPAFITAEPGEMAALIGGAGAVAAGAAKAGGDTAAGAGDAAAGAGDAAAGAGDAAAGAGDAAPAEDDHEGPKEWTRERVIEHAANEGIFDGEDLSELDLSEVDLSGRSMRDVALRATNLRGAKLVGTTLDGAEATGADFSSADLTEASLVDIDGKNCVFSGATVVRTTMNDGDFSDARFSESTFDESVCEHASFINARFTGVTFNRCNFEYADFTSGKLERVQAHESRFVDASLDSVTAEGIVLRACDLSQLRADERSNFRNADLRESQANGSIWDDSDLGGANLSGVDLERASFTDCNLTGAKFVAANMPDANLEGAVLHNALLTGANLFRVTFERAQLHGASLLQANAYEAEFLEAELEGAKFGGADVTGTKLAK